MFYDPTFEVECLVPPGVECPPLDLGLEPVLLVRKQGNADVGVTQTVRVLGSQVAGLDRDTITVSYSGNKSFFSISKTFF